MSSSDSSSSCASCALLPQTSDELASDFETTYVELQETCSRSASRATTANCKSHCATNAAPDSLRRQSEFEENSNSNLNPTLNNDTFTNGDAANCVSPRNTISEIQGKLANISQPQSGKRAWIVLRALPAPRASLEQASTSVSSLESATSQLVRFDANDQNAIRAQQVSSALSFYENVSVADSNQLFACASQQLHAEPPQTLTVAQLTRAVIDGQSSEQDDIDAQVEPKA